MVPMHWVEMKKRIQFVFSTDAISHWETAFAAMEFNRYEAQTLRGFFEEMHHLTERRDDIDELRFSCDVGPESGMRIPDNNQKRMLYSRTKVYFDTYYGALSHLSSVVARFSRVFGGIAISDNGPFLNWLRDFCESFGPYDQLGHLSAAELEKGRLFRALLNHPQQFPVLDWSTETRPGYEVLHLVLHGPESRNGKIPRGSTRDWLHGQVDADWRMEAPDEVSLTNCLANGAMMCLAAIYAARAPGSTFRPAESRMSDALRIIAGRDE
jgi:hypothetical protein